MRRFLFCFACLVFAVLAVPAAHAQTTPLDVAAGEEILKKNEGGESYAPVGLRDLHQTFLMMGGLDVRDNRVIDEYAKMNYCRAYLEKFKNDFEWNAARQKIAGRIDAKKEYYRVLYEVTGTVQLGRYNFETQDFPFIKGALLNVGSMSVLTKNQLKQTLEQSRQKKEDLECFSAFFSDILPTGYNFTMSQPLTLDRLKIGVEEAEKVLSRMMAEKNTSRILHVRFRFKVLGIDVVATNGSETRRKKLTEKRNVSFRSELKSIDLYMDEGLTRHVASIPVMKL